MSKKMSRYPSDRKVYVGDLGSNAKKNDLEYAFRAYGILRSIWIARNPPGFAFVEFEDAQDAADAVRGLDGRTLCGRRARVELSTGKYSNGGRGGQRRNYNADEKCYECGGRGHYARECRRRARRRSESRSRSHSTASRDGKSTSRERHSRSRSDSQSSSLPKESRNTRDVHLKFNERGQYENGQSISNRYNDNECNSRDDSSSYTKKKRYDMSSISPTRNSSQMNRRGGSSFSRSDTSRD
ncbi:serine/arginine-rich splicing factor 3 [Teleopsis dalmanni]|uniref:serine/arginine-rich splicing factor 3 n=1 Tax=Teleopsis dalmanni TaxID=139649 RepID=UPI0018CD530D|nr:serine/arginine-rich splicing factor 3 [Teleopsis dalmanni]